MLNYLAGIFGAMMARLQREEGQTMVEYAFLVAFIALVVLAGVTLLGVNLDKFFSSIAGQV